MDAKNNDELSNDHKFPVYLCSRDSAITRDSEGEPIPYKNATNDDLPDINVFIKTLLLKELNQKFHSSHALSMEDYLELEKYSHNTQLSLLDSVKYSRHCHQCGDDMGEKRFKQIYCCDDCEIAVEVYERDCICTKLNAKHGIIGDDCKICSRKGNFIFNLRYGVYFDEKRIKHVRGFAKQNRLTIPYAIALCAEFEDCGKDCELCYN